MAERRKKSVWQLIGMSPRRDEETEEDEIEYEETEEEEEGSSVETWTDVESAESCWEEEGVYTEVARLPWQNWPQLITPQIYGADGSELCESDEVYVLTNPITDTIQTIDYFFYTNGRAALRRVMGMGPYAIM